jgi:LCP family protein required for cell wall assembly
MKPIRLATLALLFLAFVTAGCGAPAAGSATPVTVAGAAAGATATPDPSGSPEPNATATPADSPTPVPTGSEASDAPADSETPAAQSPDATPTRRPTATPTSLPQVDPTAALNYTGSMREGEPTPPTPIPSPVPVFDVPEGTTNILLLGKDLNADGSGDSRTDTMIIVSVNRETQTASMISLPRDLYVYLPNRIMSRLNTAVTLGGIELLEQTILYNFGIPIHYHAQVDFEGFKRVVDLLGGVQMAVSCPLQDWRLISPELDPTVEENWEQFRLEAGTHQMDGDLALWYARSRLTTTDFDRGRRQQQLLQAMLNQSVDLGLVARAPELWLAFEDVVETNMDIGRILQLATIAPGVRANGVQHLYLAGKMQAWTIPESGANVQLPVWEGENMMADTFRRLFLPPALNRADRAPITVEIINASQYPAQALLAADNLAWYGFAPVISDPIEPQETTELTYYGQNFKGSYDWLFSWVMGKPQENIELVDEESPYNYRVVIGDDYNPCRPAFEAPQSAPTAES